jgi:hypothetical protein
VQAQRSIIETSPFCTEAPLAIKKFERLEFSEKGRLLGPVLLSRIPALFQTINKRELMFTIWTAGRWIGSTDDGCLF